MAIAVNSLFFVKYITQLITYCNPMKYYIIHSYCLELSQADVVDYSNSEVQRIG